MNYKKEMYLDRGFLRILQRKEDTGIDGIAPIVPKPPNEEGLYYENGKRVHGGNINPPSVDEKAIEDEFREIIEEVDEVNIENWLIENISIYEALSDNDRIIVKYFILTNILVTSWIINIDTVEKWANIAISNYGKYTQSLCDALNDLVNRFILPHIFIPTQEVLTPRNVMEKEISNMMKSIYRTTERLLTGIPYEDYIEVEDIVCIAIHKRYETLITNIQKYKHLYGKSYNIEDNLLGNFPNKNVYRWILDSLKKALNYANTISKKPNQNVLNQTLTGREQTYYTMTNKIVKLELNPNICQHLQINEMEVEVNVWKLFKNNPNMLVSRNQDTGAVEVLYKRPYGGNIHGL